MSAPADLERLKRPIIARHARPDNVRAALQVLVTLGPLAVLWVGTTLGAPQPWWLTVAIVLLMSLFLLRAFVLMHECGHGSLFRGARLNRVFGFLFGVVTGMPQFVWSAHHRYHHATNGNWLRYRGPLSVIPADEYAAMDAAQQRRYRNARNIWRTPHAGLFYLVIVPRRAWLLGTLDLLRHALRRRRAQRGLSWTATVADFRTPHWDSPAEYRHLLWTSIALFCLWGGVAWLVGPLLFVVCHTVSISIAGWMGIVIFTVQHNFEHSYASGDDGWDYHAAAMHGTSFLALPAWLNWFTACIGYHHIHHLSARIPAYRLAACHRENLALFAGVRRIRLAQIPHALTYILWDRAARRLISVAEFERAAAAG